MKLMFFIKTFLGAKGCFTEILIKTKSELTLNFLAFLQETLYLTYRGYSKSLVNKSQIKEVDPTCVCVHSLSCTPHFFNYSCVGQSWTVKLQHTSERVLFGGSSPRKF